MNFKKGLLSITVLMTLSGFGFTDIYKWVDDKGVTHFSDSPHQGASKVTLPKMKVVPQEENVETPNAKPMLSASDNETKNEASSYTAIEITTPPNEATIRNNEGSVSVEVSLSPKLNPKDKVQLYLDGKKVGNAQSNLQFSLNNVYRGEHQIMAEVIDGNGQSKIKSSNTTFFMFRNFIQRKNPNAPHI